MKNVKNLFLIVVTILLISGQQVYASSNVQSSNILVSLMPPGTGVVDIIQGRMAVTLIMADVMEISLRLTTDHGVDVYQYEGLTYGKIHVIPTINLPAGSYRLTTKTALGEAEFDISIE